MFLGFLTLGLLASVIKNFLCSRSNESMKLCSEYWSFSEKQRGSNAILRHGFPVGLPEACQKKVLRRRANHRHKSIVARF
jgi:hypothetical protein